MDERKIMADSKVEPLNYSQFQITFSLNFFRETKQKQKQITPKQQSLLFSCLSAFHFLRQDFFPFVPWFPNATILCGTFSQGWAAAHIKKKGGGGGVYGFHLLWLLDFFKHSKIVYSLK